MNAASEEGNKRIEALAEGRIGKTLLSLSIPTVAGMLVMAVYNIVDTFFVGMLRDATSLAATGVVFPIFQLIGAVGLTFGIGAASVISRRLGEDKYEEAQKTGVTAFYTTLFIGLGFSFLGALFAAPLLRLFGATDSIIAEAAGYGRIILGGAVFQILNMSVGNMLRAEGAASHASIGQILGAVLNIILDPIFIFGLNMGVAGAAAATVIAQGVGTLYLMSVYFRGKTVLRITRFAYFTPKRWIYAGIMAVGTPTLARQVLGSVSMGLLNNAAGRFGDVALAAMSVNFRIFMLVMAVLIGMSQGLQPLAGYNYGASQFNRVRGTLKISMLFSLGFAGCAGLILAIFAPTIIGIFAPQNEAVIQVGAMGLRLTSAGAVPMACAVVFGGFFQALGKAKASLLLALGQQGIFLVPMALLLPMFFGIEGVFAAMPVAFTMAFAVGLILLQRVLRELNDSPAAGREAMTGI